MLSLSSVVLSSSGIWFLLAGYFLLAPFIVVERMLRRSKRANTLQRGSFDRGSTLLVGSAFGSGLLLPLILDILGIGLFSINLVEGLVALAVMVIGMGLSLGS